MAGKRKITTRLGRSGVEHGKSPMMAAKKPHPDDCKCRNCRRVRGKKAR